MKIRNKIIAIGFCLMQDLSLQAANAAGEAVEYHFERMLSPTAQTTPFDPLDVFALAGDGSVWVYVIKDKIENAHVAGIAHWSASGQLIGQSAEVQVPPTRASVTADGSLWLAFSRDEPYLQQYNADGKLMNQFVHQANSAGQYSNITSIAAAKDGSVWVVDYPRVQHFTADGQLIAQYSPNSSVGLLDSAQHIALAADGSIWIAAHTDQHCKQGCLQHFGVDGLLIAQFGSPGANAGGLANSEPPAGQLDGIVSLAIAADGSVWVAEYAHRIQHFSADGRLIRAVDSVDDFPLNTLNPAHIFIAANGDLWVRDESARLLHFNAAGDYLGKLMYSPQNRLSDIALAKDGSLWLTDSWSSRIQHFDTQGQFIGEFGKPGNAAGQFYQPQGLASADDNSLWVADTGNQRIQHLNPAGQFIGQFPDGIAPWWRTAFAPSKISLSANGSFWVMKSREDLIYNRIFYIAHHNVDGSVIAEFQRAKGFTSGNSNLQLGSIAAAKDGSAWVVDAKLNSIQHFDAELKLLSQVGSAGAGAGQFNAPEGIAVATDGSIWVADTGNNRVQHFNTDGRFIAQYGNLGSAAGQFNAPKDVEIAEDGSLWVLDSGNNRIQKFVPKTLQNSPAEYDDKNGLLYLDDVAVSGVHYQATLQLQNDQYRLLTLLPALNTYNPAASFDAGTNLLSIPLARAFGQDYQAQFNYLGDSVFQLQSATLK